MIATLESQKIDCRTQIPRIQMLSMNSSHCRQDVLILHHQAVASRQCILQNGDDSPIVSGEKSKALSSLVEMNTSITDHLDLSEIHRHHQDMQTVHLQQDVHHQESFLAIRLSKDIIRHRLQDTLAEIHRLYATCEIHRLHGICEIHRLQDIKRKCSRMNTASRRHLVATYTVKNHPEEDLHQEGIVTEVDQQIQCHRATPAHILGNHRQSTVEVAIKIVLKFLENTEMLCENVEDL